MRDLLKIITLYFVVVSVFSCSNPDYSEKITLSGKWQFKQYDSLRWSPAKVPGCVHLDLLQNNLIENPFYSNNESNLQWIGKESWVYQKKFTVKHLDLYNHSDLVFEGLDTYAKVWLNGKFIDSTSNMFQQYHYECQGLLKEGVNVLKVVFSSSVEVNNAKQILHKCKLPDNRAYSRKAPFQFGWDWSPTFVTAGIWKPVYIKRWNSFVVNDVHVVQKVVSDTLARLNFKYVITADTSACLNVAVIDSVEDSTVANRLVLVSKGTNTYNLTFDIHNPKLWWPNGLGNPNLYKFHLVVSRNDWIVFTKKINVGLRTIKLVQEVDSVGESFYFKVNGKPLFIKGANYVPQDNFLSRVNCSDYQKIVTSAKWANMNMLRVWGGGIYENNLFYDLCDQNGILVWQDFMFACNMYPSDSAFLASVESEAVCNVKRLRNHACIALWCGNNEVLNGWNDWGWQKEYKYSIKDSLKLKSGYDKIFESLLPSVVSKYDSGVAYVSTSPLWGWGHDESFSEGDCHYWGVWWGNEPFSKFNNKVGRFMSEYGFQSLPCIETIKEFAPLNELNISSKSLVAHQKHPIGYDIINTYMQREYEIPVGFDRYVYKSQLLQAYGMKTAIEAQRRAVPFCMGTLYWQLNDSWPAVSWSSLDYYKRKKASHYFVKKSYRKLIISPIYNNDTVSVFVESDSVREGEYRFKLSVCNFYGKQIWSSNGSVSLCHNQSKLVFRNSLKSIISKSDSNSLFLYAELFDSKGNMLTDNVLYFNKTKYLNLLSPLILKSFNRVGNRYDITLKANVLVKNLYLYSDEFYIEFSDNYFDMIPDSTYNIHFKSTSTFNIDSIKMMYINNSK